MKHVLEQTGRRYCSYLVTDEAGDSRVCRVQVRYEDGDLAKPVVYASDWSVILDATMFLREGLKYDGVNTRKQAASAVKLLYSFLDVFGFSLEKLTKQQARALVEFMRGTLGSSSSCTVELARVRDEGSVSDYLSVIRRLARYLELDDRHPLLKKKSQVGGKRRPQTAGKPLSEPYEVTVKTVDELMAPMHVSTPQYRELLACEHVRGNLRDRVIIRLMREAGLRAGEFAGLALEDITSYVDADGMTRTCIEIRNRLSDAPDQHAKTAMKVRAERDYLTPEYQTALAGYEVVTLGFDLADELMAYIQEAHMASHGERYWERREATARADKVTGRLGDEDNYYVFLNTLGRPLSQNRWSQILREIYKEAGIPIDRGRKVKNLSHRLRHGYAMYLKHERGCDEYEVMVLMRHSSLESQKPYTNPTPEDILRIQERIVDGRE